MKKYNIAVVGATGNVGREILSILQERNFPFGKVFAVASSSSIGKEVSFGEIDVLKVQAIDNFDFTQADITFFATNTSVSSKYCQEVAKQSIVIDNSSYFRMDNNIPLIVPEVNAEDLKKSHKLIANPNCSTIQMVVALSPIHNKFGLKRVVVSTYQSVSGAGKEAMDELFEQTKGVYVNNIPQSKSFPTRIAFNIIPQIEQIQANGYSREEMKMINETNKIFGKNIQVTATCVRVPVFVGHSESINIELRDTASVKEIKNVLMHAPGVSVIDRVGDNGYITPFDVVQEDDVFIARIRADNTLQNCFNLWVVADNLRKGAALNAVQIAELITKRDASITY